MSLRVLLGVVSSGSPTAVFLSGLAALELPASVERLDRSVAFGNFIPGQRELIMDDALAGGYDYLFFVDDDIALPADALTQLLETAERDPQTGVVGGLYYTRDSTRPVVVADWSSDDTSTGHIPPYTSTSVDSVDGVGFGCALLRLSTAAAFTRPFFPAHIFIERTARFVRQCDEDYLYCERVRRAGGLVRLDARVRCGHYDRSNETTAPLLRETDDETNRPRMTITRDGRAQVVPFDSNVPRTVERHVRADVTYITVDD